MNSPRTPRIAVGTVTTGARAIDDSRRVDADARARAFAPIDVVARTFMVESVASTSGAPQCAARQCRESRRDDRHAVAREHVPRGEARQRRAAQRAATTRADAHGC